MDKFRRGRETERAARWNQVVLHHPIYYVDFPDLKKIIERDENWRRVFGRIFGRKDLVSAALSESEAVRNKIAHNRRATGEDVHVIQGVYSKLSSAVGAERFIALSARCTSAQDIVGLVTSLRQEVEETFSACQHCKPLDPPTTWSFVRDAWWFDDSYLGHPLDALRDFFDSRDQYSHLPRSRGSGFQIQRWIANSGLPQRHADAMAALTALLN